MGTVEPTDMSTKQKLEQPLTPKFHYPNHREEWIEIRGKKMKLRKCIANFARQLSSINKLPFINNRFSLINAFSLGGFDNVLIRYNEEIQRFIKKQEVKK